MRNEQHKLKCSNPIICICEPYPISVECGCSYRKPQFRARVFESLQPNVIGQPPYEGVQSKQHAQKSPGLLRFIQCAIFVLLLKGALAGRDWIQLSGGLEARNTTLADLQFRSTKQFTLMSTPRFVPLEMFTGVILLLVTSFMFPVDKKSSNR